MRSLRLLAEHASSLRRCRSWLLVTAMTAAAVGGGCKPNSTVATAPTQAKCQVALAASSSTIGNQGGTGTFTVTTAPECPWDVSTGVNWLSGLSPTSGQGNGTVEFRAAPNPLPAAREGEIVVNDNRLRVSQQAAPCRLDVQPGSLAIDAAGGAREIAVSAASACTWAVTTDATWISFTTPVARSGNGSVGVRIAPNLGDERRIGTVVVGDQRVTVTQEPEGVGSPCVYVISSTSQPVLGAGAAQVAVSVTVASGCAWTASSNDAWIRVTSGASGAGSGVVTLSVEANQSAVRTGTIIVAGQTFVVTQAASATPCTYAISAPSVAIAAPGGAGTVAVSTGTNCTWTATSNAAWVTVTVGGSGTGNGVVSFSVEANPGPVRTSTIAVAGRTFTVTQAAATVPCTYAIGATSAAIAAPGGTGTVAVSTATGCAWAAASNAAWITVTSGASGTGNGAVAFSVAANTGGVRTGTITVAGQTFTVTQAAAAVPCAYTISPTTAAIAAPGGTGSVAVSTGTGCAWTAATNAAWIVVTSGASGTGNGAVAFSVAANPGSARTGTLTVAGRTFTVTQAAVPAPCTYTINPTSASLNDRAQTGTVAVSAGTGCAWTATSNAAWITITSVASGQGNGSVAFSVTANTADQDRTGTVTIAGRTFTVTQRN